jgi:hypothetical protein
MANPELPSNSLTLDLPLTPSYRDEHLQLTQQGVPVILDLSGGSRTFISDPQTVGTYRGLDVKAQLSFGYEYRRDENKLVIRGNDDRTPDQLTITTFVSGAPDQALDQEPTLVFRVMPNDIAQNIPHRNMWADHVGGQPELHSALSDVARNSNDVLVQEAMAAGVSSVLEIGTPPIVTLDNLDDWKRAFGEPVTAEMPADLVAEVIRMQHKVDSTYVGTVTWAGNADFANVIGSTHDPKVPDYPTWIGLWKNKCNGDAAPTKCASEGYASDDTHWTCSTTYFGGHVITGTVAKEMSKGSQVYIYPICNLHNSHNSGYMKVKNYPTGCELKYWET